MAFETELINKTREFVEAFLTEKSKGNLYYHDLEHTRDVAKAAEEIGRASDLKNDDLETVLIAAWFHDTGYYKGVENHELVSREIAINFLRESGAPEKKINDVAGCIIATKLPQRPLNTMEEVLCDADLYHLSSKEFFTKSELLRKELSESRNDEILDAKWFRKSMKFLKKHSFFTAYAREKLMPEKEENLKRLKAIVKDYQNEEEPAANGSSSETFSGAEVIKDKPGRGVETLFRITSRNHIDFSTMADSKANIMISINSIMISILFSVLFRRFEEYPNLIIPSIILSLTCLTTIIFAVIATRPTYTSGIFNREDIEKRRANLLFFGNFHKMPLDSYEWGMRQVISNYDFLYGSIIRDIYFLGKVLGKKYLLLRISYTIFMFGLIISVIAFAVAVFYFRSPAI